MYGFKFEWVLLKGIKSRQKKGENNIYFKLRIYLIYSSLFEKDNNLMHIDEDLKSKIIIDNFLFW